MARDDYDVRNRPALFAPGFVFVAFVAGLIFSCAHWPPPDPHYKPIPACSGETGRTLRASDQINSEQKNCYACESAQRCYFNTDQYCCATPMCSECQTSPVNLGAHRDAGVDGGLR